MSKARLPLYVPSAIKSRLEVMSDETGISQNQLVVLAINSLVYNFDKNGAAIFANLLDLQVKLNKE